MAVINLHPHQECKSVPFLFNYKKEQMWISGTEADEPRAC